MPLCDHFIYTSAKLEQTGYQVVAKSSGITNKILSELEDYLYPIGSDSAKFRNSKSLLISKNYVAFINAKNIGIGYDGRDNTVYSHTVLIRHDDFKKLKNDTRIFDKYFIRNFQSEHLPPIVIEPEELLPAVAVTDKISSNLLKNFLKSILLKNKIAILQINDYDLIQELLSLLPPSLRLISFSSLVIQPSRQSKFEIIQTPPENQSIVKNEYEILHPDSLDYDINHESVFEESIDHFIQIIQTLDPKKLLHFHDLFDYVLIPDLKTRFSFVTLLHNLDVNNDHNAKKRYMHNALSILDKLDENSGFQCFLKLRKYMDYNEIYSYEKKFQFHHILNKYSSESLTFTTIVKMFDELNDPTFMGRNELLTKLIVLRRIEFEKNAKDILLTSQLHYSTYASDMINFYINNKFLHQYIIEVLQTKTIQSDQLRRIYDKLIDSALDNDHLLLETLLKLPIFDLANNFDTYEFRNLIRRLFTLSKFHHDVQPSIIISIIAHLRHFTEIVFVKNRKSGNSNISEYNLQEVLYILLNTTKYLSIVRGVDIQNIINKVENEEKTLQSLLNNYGIPESNYIFLDIRKPIPNESIKNLFDSFS